MDERRGDGVGVDPVAPPLDGKAAREVRHRCLGRAVHRLTRKRHLTGLRGDVDDAAESSLAHRRERCSTGEERASQVDVERSLKCGERYLFDRGVGLSPAGIVDEEVHPTELLDCRRDGGLDLIEPADVHLQGQRSPAERADLLRKALVAGHVPKTECDVRARFCERDRDPPSQTARCSGDQGCAPTQIEPPRAHSPYLLSAAPPSRRTQSPSNLLCRHGAYGLTGWHYLDRPAGRSAAATGA